MATKARPTGDAKVSFILPPDVAKSFEHHAASLSVTPLELVEMSVRMVVDPRKFLTVYRVLVEPRMTKAENDRLCAEAYLQVLGTE
jgi:hypothetical protein